MKSGWTREEFVTFLEGLVREDIPAYNNPHFRGLLNRDQNLFMNQVVREATGRVAYSTVDRDVLSMSDEDFWRMIDSTEYSELIEENAAIAIMKMAAKLGFIG